MTGTVEREVTLVMLDRRKTRNLFILKVDKTYDMTDFVGDLRARGVTPHIAFNGTVSKLGVVRKTAIVGATSRSEGYATSQRCRKRIEETWLNTDMLQYLRASFGTRLWVLLAHASPRKTEIELQNVGLCDCLPGIPGGADALMTLSLFSAAEPLTDAALFLLEAADQTDTTLGQVVTALQKTEVRIDSRVKP